MFENEIVPLAGRLRAQGRELLPAGPDPALGSYYQRRALTTMSRADFEVSGPGSVEDFRAAIMQLWRSQGLSELEPLAPSLARIADAVRLVEEQGDEVSPFVYVMF